MASILIRKRSQDATAFVGEKWVYNFISRHDSLKSRFSRQISYKRAKCEDPKVIQAWFQRVQAAIAMYGIADEDIYNFDETGFAMGLAATAKVVTRSSCEGRPFLIQPGNREWITSIECINAAGWVLPAYLVVKAKTYTQAWFEGNTPSSWRINISSNGWTNREIGEHWLKEHFIPYIKDRRTGQYSLLVLDGHDSHLTPHFDDICRQYDIIPICMPANSSPRCQPLDIACFSPLKSAYSNLIERLVRAGYHHIDKVDFLDIYPEAHVQAFKKANIQSAFKASGIVPFDPTKVLDNLIFCREESRPIEHENLQLRETVERQKRKQQRNQHQMHGLDGFTIQEAREAFANAQAAEEAAGDTGPLDSQPRRRAPPRCSRCHVVGHIRTRCPNQTI
ncbi:uncharacterized protein KD926_010911 [Aspergillus affinis]|uniref:uncharacterized protein n=1 Tax=Aspergillus affinis TaxID=1070780 RepID=UPI0022FE68CC|nr:uncharacterized protein KD926_010911 [Aspergillus affinis]KAI9038375.1 hypothetical protein KD926_010911 [Aspergillus affinis]